MKDEFVLVLLDKVGGEEITQVYLPKSTVNLFQVGFELQREMDSIRIIKHVRLYFTEDYQDLEYVQVELEEIHGYKQEN